MNIELNKEQENYLSEVLKQGLENIEDARESNSIYDELDMKEAEEQENFLKEMLNKLNS